ncbi:MAG: cob(I)yrinic acid a,c-diamide adenosyltransferase [Candidatus Giovannonibacteria bacterium]|nr:MAG: cob(I)yrinic acid a,c-diamide adenosyltransferase [Candidatus Giovannonibacteria bacterium]
MKFYTGQGDKGESAILGESCKIPKTEPVFDALGALDELNSYLGVCRALAKDEKVTSALLEAQENLFTIQAELGGAENIALGEEKIKALEKTIDEFGGFVGPITKFTIPGGDFLSACLDFARAMARLAERRAWAAKEKLSAAALAYLNRLSSLLFVLARYANKKAGVSENHPRYG